MTRNLIVLFLIVVFAENAPAKHRYYHSRYRPSESTKTDRRQHDHKDSRPVPDKQVEPQDARNTAPSTKENKPYDVVPATFLIICQYEEPSNEKVILTIRAGTEVVEECPVQIFQTLAPKIGRIFSLGEYNDRFCRYASVLNRDSNHKILAVEGGAELPAIKVSNGIVTCPKN